MNNKNKNKNYTGIFRTYFYKYQLCRETDKYNFSGVQCRLVQGVGLSISA